ncbi:CRISPR-associated endonuclease Cas2 [Vibrio sp. WXL210]|uniref:CRISPR-associated endonuclease Cas2 n=1 Tax=Vibrio sp. WXL210 TaxID=3450709 RepID=UPI003EC57C68
MFILVCFDVSQSRVRRRLVRALLEHGWRIQYSVFEIRLRRGEFTRLQQKIDKLLQPGDRVHYYPLCGKDIGQRKADGKGTIAWHCDWLIVS